MKQKNWLMLGAGGILVIAIVITVLVMGSHTQTPEPEVISRMDTTTSDVTESQTESQPVSETENMEVPEEVPEYPVVSLDVPEVQPTEAHIVLEAENAAFEGGLFVEDIRRGFSGTGYLTGFVGNPDDRVQASLTIPSAQHYDITISVCADTPVTNTLLLNGEKLGDFTISESGHFVRVTFSGVYLPAGDAVLSIQEVDGNFSLDYFEISNFEEMYQLDYQTVDDLSDANASAGAKELMAFLKEQYGKTMITGQYASSPENTELELLYHLTGKYPAIRFADIEGIRDSQTQAQSTIEACKQWAEQGGIVGLMWYWEAPCEKSSVYAKETDFSLKAAMTAEEIAGKTPEELKTLYENKKISEQCYAVLQDIDSMAELLKPLADADVPVLWRPLHEAGGDWFWWGRDGAEAYRWLWNLLYTRMTEYHALHNLLWVWNGQSAEYLVDASQYDIASLDIYHPAGEAFGSQYEPYVVLSRMTEGRKLLAMSETSSIPEMNAMFRDNCIWSFFGLWYGEYLMDKEGRYAVGYTSAEDMVALYNSEAAVTLDDLQKP